MKLSRLAAVFIIVTIALSAIPVGPSAAAGPYSEKLTAYVAGSSAFWFFTFDGINVTVPAVATVEGIQGVNWYNVTALKTTSWSSDFQIFGPNGYNVIPVPFVPSQGAFLAVGASDYSSAASAAAAFNSYLYTSFVSLSNSSGEYEFYSPLSFNPIVSNTLLKLVPSGMGGFASAVSGSSFLNLKSPMITLGGVRGSAGFTHSLSAGSIVLNIMGTNSQPKLLSFFGKSVTTLSSSSKSGSSSISVRFLDGIINSSDTSAVASNAGWSGKYSLTVPPKTKITGLNVTVLQEPPFMIAERVIDRGVLMTGDNVSVSITLSNLAQNSSISTSAFSDSWWQAYSFFKLAPGSSSSFPAQTLEGGSTNTPTYVLEYDGTATENVQIPAITVPYTFKVGSITFHSQATTNPAFLSLGADEPVIYSYVEPTSGYGAAVGGTTQLSVVAKNVGTLTAPTVVIAGKNVHGLIAGGTASNTVTVAASYLTQANFSKSYTVSYLTSGSQNVSVVTNPVPILFSHTLMTIGFPTLRMSSTMTVTKTGVTNLTVFFVTYNGGSTAVSSFAAGGLLPAGLSCGKIRGTGLTCSGNSLSLSYSSVGTGDNKTASMEFDLNSHANYFFRPLSFHAQTSGVSLAGSSNAVATPTGLTVTKQFASSILFTGMFTTVTVNSVNSGPFDFYNMTVQTTGDSFDKTNTTTAKTLLDVAPAGNLTFAYKVNTTETQSHANVTSASVASTLFFGGVRYHVAFPGPAVTVYAPVGISIQTTPVNPTEGKPFSILLKITNPSGVAVSNVQFSLPIPGSMSLTNLRNVNFSDGSLQISVDHLAPQEAFVGNVTAQATSGITVAFKQSHLTFVYSGVTLNGNRPSKGIVIGEDVLTRYVLPSLLVLAALLATAFYVRRKAAPTSPASRQ